MPRECWKHSGAVVGWLVKARFPTVAIIAGPAFCDYVSCTTARDIYPEVSTSLLELLRAAGGRDEHDGVLTLGDHGKFIHGTRYGVGYYSLSGDALAELRKHHDAFDFFGQWLTIIGEHPHRVTRLDAAIDIAAEASTVVRRVYARARRGLVRLTRKATRPDEVRRLIGPALVTGLETGTVYIGARGRRDVTARVYDKREEILRRVMKAHGSLTADLLTLNDPGPLVRYELEFSRKIGMTLRDAYDPAALFWHFARESLVPQLAPADVGSWEPRSGGFAVPRVESLPSVQLRLLLDTSQDIKRAVTLAERCGPYGLDLLCRWLCAVEPAATPAVLNHLQPATLNTVPPS